MEKVWFCMHFCVKMTTQLTVYITGHYSAGGCASQDVMKQ